jgi:hypothetical protein
MTNFENCDRLNAKCADTYLPKGLLVEGYTATEN